MRVNYQQIWSKNDHQCVLTHNLNISSLPLSLVSRKLWKFLRKAVCGRRIFSLKYLHSTVGHKVNKEFHEWLCTLDAWQKKVYVRRCERDVLEVIITEIIQSLIITQYCTTFQTVSIYSLVHKTRSFLKLKKRQNYVLWLWVICVASNSNSSK